MLEWREWRLKVQLKFKGRPAAFPRALRSLVLNEIESRGPNVPETNATSRNEVALTSFADDVGVWKPLHTWCAQEIKSLAAVEERASGGSPITGFIPPH
jgi:hypothetical protein